MGIRWDRCNCTYGNFFSSRSLVYLEKYKLNFRFQINITLIRCFLGHHKKNEPILTAESSINENSAWSLPTADLLIAENAAWPIVTAQSSNNEQAPWHNDLLETPVTYETSDLHEWHYPPQIVSKNPRGHGEMGKIFSSIIRQNENISF